MKLRFTKKCGVEGRLYEAGTVIDSADIPEGSLNSLRLLGVYEEVTDEPVPAPDVVDEPPAVKTETEPSEPETPVDSNKSSKKGK